MRLATLLCVWALAIPAPAVTPVDPLLQKARAFVGAWIGDSSGYVCRQSTRRYFAGCENLPRWKPEGTSTAMLAVEKGVERYLLVEVDGRKVTPRDAEFDVLGSTGEFQSAIRALFDPAANARFLRRGHRTKGGLRQRAYDFTVRKESSQWFLGPVDGVAAPYRGRVWIDEATGGISELLMEAYPLPAHFVLRYATLQLKFAPVTIGSETRLMPSEAQVDVRDQHGIAQRKKIEFSLYSRYLALPQ